MELLTRRTLLQSASAGAFASLLAPECFSQKKTDPYADGVLVNGEPDKPAKDSFTIAVLPDTQNYSEKFPEQYLAQARWIAENKKDRNIACVLHLGDVTNHNSAPEWDNAIKAMSQLDGVLRTKKAFESSFPLQAAKWSNLSVTPSHGVDIHYNSFRSARSFNASAGTPNANPSVKRVVCIRNANLTEPFVLTSHSFSFTRKSPHGQRDKPGPGSTGKKH
jgi:hypothetical protein